MRSSFFKSVAFDVSDFFFMLLIGVFLGILGQVVQRPAMGILCSVLLVALFTAYTFTLKQNEGIWSGLIAGIVLGVSAAGVGFLISRQSNTLSDHMLSGLFQGAIFGAIAGLITRAHPDAEDAWSTRLFLISGSVVMGAFFGGSVGLVTGFFLGLIVNAAAGLGILILLGVVVGGYLGSAQAKWSFLLLGALGGGGTAVLSWIIGGIPTGFMIGILTGAITPMMLVALIGAYGGLTARGPVAMVIEAIEAPRELVMQDAVPYLAPSILVGLLVGTISQGLSSVLALPTVLGAIGVFLGALREVDKRPSHRVTSQTIIDMIIIGTDNWPIRRAVMLLFQENNRKTVLTGILISLLISIGGSIAGLFLIQFVTEFMSGL